MIWYSVITIETEAQGGRWFDSGWSDYPQQAIKVARRLLPTHYDRIIVRRNVDSEIIWDSVDHNW